VKIEFTIRGQPVSLKNSYRVITINKHGAMTKSDDAKAYERAFRQQLPVSARQMLTGPVRVTMRLFYAWNGPDLDGALLLDLMQAEYRRLSGKLISLGNGEYGEAKGERVLVSKGVYENDRQVREIHQYHAIDKANPRAEIEVEPMLPQQVDLLDGVPALQPDDDYDKPPF
jgi:Holliday junction resolvase RusA-like endonuclease